MLSSNPTLLRIGFSVCLLISFLTLPWWITFGLGIIGVIAFSWFVEAVLLMFYIDGVFAVGWISWLGFSMIVVLLLVELVTYLVSN